MRDLKLFFMVDFLQTSIVGGSCAVNEYNSLELTLLEG
jgi:hypothetical protein